MFLIGGYTDRRIRVLRKASKVCERIEIFRDGEETVRAGVVAFLSEQSICFFFQRPSKVFILEKIINHLN